MSGERVLIVDDDRIAGAVYRQALELEGLQVDSVSNGFEALRRIEVRPPDLIVLDMMMPVMDGWQVLEKLRFHQAPPPVVVVSASANVKQLAAAGVAACFSKPFGLAGFRETCVRILRGAQASEA
jgi:CheY-like chemotaxis protein